MNRSTSLLFASLLLVLSLVLLGCGGSDVPAGDTCAPGETQLCLCTATENGIQTCNDNGTGWGSCEQCAAGDTAQPPADTGAPDTTTPPADGDQCFTQHSKKCVGKDVYWFDSCDEQESLVESCDIGCTEGQCAQGCVPKDSKQCVGDQLYFFDSCGVQGGVVGAEACTAEEFCKDDPNGGFCIKPYYNGKWKLTGTGSVGCTWADQILDLTVDGTEITATSDVIGAAVTLDFAGTLDGKAFTITAEYEHSLSGLQETTNKEVIEATFTAADHFEGVDTHTYVQSMNLAASGGCTAETCALLGGTCDGDLCSVEGLCYYTIAGQKM